MLAVAGFAIGYVVGAREGREGLERLVSATRHVLASDEFKALVETGRTVATGLVKEGLSQVAGMAASETRGLTGRLRAA